MKYTYKFSKRSVKQLWRYINHSREMGYRYEFLLISPDLYFIFFCYSYKIYLQNI